MPSRRKPGKPLASCKCEHSFTCRDCLNNAPPYHFTPSTITEQAARPYPRPANSNRRILTPHD